MVEGWLAWFLLIAGLLSDAPTACIAAGAFAIAAQLSRIADRMDGKK